jgi:hypothetical protein
VNHHVAARAEMLDGIALPQIWHGQRYEVHGLCLPTNASMGSNGNA